MVTPLFHHLSWIGLWCLIATVAAGGKTPLYGWCKGSHRPKKPAQSGYDGYCKLCYKEKFPRKYVVKQKARQQVCRICQKTTEVVNSICRPCSRLHCCHTCNNMNEAADTPMSHAWRGECIPKLMPVPVLATRTSPQYQYKSWSRPQYYRYQYQYQYQYHYYPCASASTPVPVPMPVPMLVQCVDMF